MQVQFQKHIFEDFGLYYERKKGEYGDGLRNKYINRSQIVDREQFLRICLAVNNDPVRARSTSINILFKKSNFDSIVPETLDYRRCIYAYIAFNQIPNIYSSSSNVNNLARYAIACVVSHRYNDHINPSQFDESINHELHAVISNWENFEKYVRSVDKNKHYYFKEIYDPITGDKTIEANWGSYYKGRTLNNDLKEYFHF